MVTQRHPADTPRPTRPTVVETGRTYAATCWRRQPRTPIPKPQPPATSVNSSTRPALTTQLTGTHVNHNFRRNDLRRTVLSTFAAQTDAFLNFFLSTRNFAHNHSTVVHLTVYRICRSADSQMQAYRCTRHSTAGGDQARRDSVTHRHSDAGQILQKSQDLHEPTVTMAPFQTKARSFVQITVEE